MSETATPPIDLAPATAAAPAPVAAPPPETPPAASPAAPAAPESLIHDAPAPQPGEVATPADPFGDILTKIPEKFHVKGDGDKLDTAASIAKALEHRDHLEKRLGAGELPPKNAAEYAFQLPEEMKDLQLKDDKMTAFKEGAHKLGFTPAQYQFAMEMHVKSVPDLMDGAAAMTAAEARAELQKVWPVTSDFETGLANSQRAIRGLPPAVVEATRELGTSPAFIQAMAHYGAQLREDRPPGDGQPPAGAPDVESLQRSEAYINPKHADHARVSEQVRQHFAKAYGTQPL